MIALSLPALAQEKDIGTLFRKYSGIKGYSTVTYGRKMLDIIKDGASPSLTRLLDNIDTITILSSQHAGPAAEAKDIAKWSGYELITDRQNEDGSSNSFYLKDGKDGNSSFLMISSGDKESIILNIYGRFSIKDISSLTAISAQ